jgi:hypothetical protein
MWRHYGAAVAARGVVMAGPTLPSKAFWVFFAAVVVSVGAVAFIVGAFVVNSPETVREVVRVPPPGAVLTLGSAPQLPKPDGPPPSDKSKAREQVIKAVEIASAGSSTREQRLSRIQDSEGQVELRQEVLVHFPLVPLDKITARVDEVRFLNRTSAAVRYTIVLPGYSIPEMPNRIGRVVLVDHTWKVTRDTACADLALGGVTCPP